MQQASMSFGVTFTISSRPCASTKFSGPMIQSIPDEQSVACDQPMKTLDQTEPVTFRLIIVRRHGSEVLFRSDESGWTLPCVKAPSLGKGRSAVDGGAAQTVWGLCLLPVHPNFP